jgi:putative spermidine/putrescine transport system substrate-binding protein
MAVVILGRTEMLLRAMLAAGLLLIGGAAGARARDLTLALTSGGPVDALQQVYVAPFLATGAKLDVATRPAGLDALRAGAAGWDVVQVGGATLLAACQDGVVDKLDWSKLGGRDRMTGPGATDCGLGAYADATVLAWDRGKFQGTPTWQDFWDIAKVPGKRGLRRSPRGTLEIALLGDGVGPGDVYHTLGTKDGVDRAFRRLDQLAPYIVWWTPGDRDALNLLGSGEVLMTSAPSSAVALANRTGSHNFGIQWSGGLVSVQDWAIVKGTQNLAEAQHFLAFAADPRVQNKLVEAAALGGLAKGANDGLSPDLQAVSPTAAANTLYIDDGFWRDNLDKLTARFQAWLPH